MKTLTHIEFYFTNKAISLVKVFTNCLWSFKKPIGRSLLFGFFILMDKKIKAGRLAEEPVTRAVFRYSDSGKTTFGISLSFLCLKIFKGVTKRYSATFDSCCGEKLLWNKRRVVSFFGRVKKNRQQWQRLTNPLFGQNQQADSCNSGIPFRELCTTKVAHAFFNFCTGVSSAIRGCAGLPSYISYSPHNYTHILSGRSASVHYQGVNE